MSDEQFHSQTLKQGGASRQVVTGHVPESGYMVGGVRNVPEETHPVDKFSVEHVRLHARAIRNALRDPDEIRNVHQGSWVHEGSVVLDASDRITHRPAAERLGKMRGQKAIYDLGRGEDLPLHK